MSKASVIIDPSFVISDIDPRLYGGFAEHLGRHIYTGMYEPGHPTADEQGFREDVMALVRELSMPVMRYPGGNFVSGYNWEDGVGPLADRPVRLDLAWHTTETNRFGTNEFIDWCRKVGTEPMIAVNLGTRGADEARSLLEYCNHPGGTQWSDLRRSHGYAEPHNVKLWCLGNEMDGPWQMGHKTAVEYGRVAAETGRMMKMYDPSLELVACGSSNRGMATYGDWEMTMLDLCFDHVDYLSLHSYYGKVNGDVPGLLGWADHMDSFIEECVSFADAIAGKRRSKKRIHLSFDEYNLMHYDEPKTTEKRWVEAPVHHETVYRMEDALAFAGLLLSLMNHADRVKIGCLAQVVNVIAPILTEPGGRAWRQSIFHPFAQVSRWGRGTALQPVLTSTTYDASNGAGFPHVKLSAVRAADGESVTIFALNRDLTAPCEFDVDLRGFTNLRVLEWQTMHDSDLLAVNTADAPTRLQPQPGTGATVDGGRLRAQLPTGSWNVIRLAVQA